MPTKKQTLEIIERLKKEYPDCRCGLNYDSAWQLLVAVRLSAQCTDKRVNIITPILFKKYPTPQSVIAAGEKAVAEIVRPCGFYNAKAHDICAAADMLVNRFDGVVPDDMDKLLSLPGVGRKSANLILGDVYGKPAVVADTHCIRLSGRIGFTDGTKDPVKVEFALKKALPPEESNDFCHRLVLHGREVCTARKANCDICCLRDLCRFAKHTAAETSAASRKSK